MTDKDRQAMGQDWEESSEDYRKMIKAYAGMAADHPEMIGQIRDNLKLSAELMYSNRPEAIDQYREAVKELDAFLSACESGEIDPKKLLEGMKEEG